MYFIILLDVTPYSQASAVRGLAARNDLACVMLSLHSPKPDPVEAYWRELRNTLSNPLFDPLDELMTAADTVLNQRSPSK
jgi:hypothetical protein